MGKIIKLRCDTCGYEKMFQIGGGMRDWDISVIRNALPEKDVCQFDAFVAAGMKNASIDRRLGVCRNCKKFINLPFVTCRMSDGTEERIRNHCPGCSDHRVEQVMLEEADRKVHCPQCKGEVSITLNGLWD